jgi:predicted alpha/beta-hydrolase family hydrolase
MTSHDDLRFDGPEGGPTLVLGHGAGAPMDSPFMEHFARGLGGAGLRIVRFEFPYMQERRRTGARKPPNRGPVLRERWLSVIERLGGGPDLVIGGKSLGGRIASMVADDVGARGLVCLGYPFHPPGKPDRLRVAHLEPLRTPALIVQGSRDALGNREEIEGYELSAQIRLVYLEDGDHSFKPRLRSGRTLDQNLDEAVSAVTGFVSGL